MPRRRQSSAAERRERRATVDDPAVVLDAAARFLEARPRSIAEVRRRLRSAGYRPELVDATIRRLADLGFLDDESFARGWVESRDRARPRSERALREELRLKGVDRAIVDAVLAERLGEDGEPPDDRAAERLLAKQARSLARVADPRLRRQRAYALLARHGFPPDVCARLAATVTAEAPVANEATDRGDETGGGDEADGGDETGRGDEAGGGDETDRGDETGRGDEADGGDETGGPLR